MIQALLVAFFFNTALAKTDATHLELQHDFKVAPEVLTTEKIWKLDPTARNPHRQRWILSKRVELLGLKSRPLSKTAFGVQAAGMVSTAQGYLRGPGVWFQPFTEFPCERQPVPGFQTEEGAKRAVARSNEVWAQLLNQEKIRLGVLLERWKAPTEAAALDGGEKIFRQWLQSVEEKWREKSEIEARRAEWNFYWQDAADAGGCKPKKGVHPQWKAWMEPLPDTPPPAVNQILARAPARLWNGLFSVRVNMGFSGKVLNGRFLIDSGARKSVVSPSWLSNQGVIPALVEIPKSLPEKVTWSGFWSPENRIVPRAWVDTVEMSGLMIPLNEFLLEETSFFSPPENVGSCCDGILGQDFLKLYPIEFQASSPSEVRVWPRAGFHWSSDTPWIELSEGTGGAFESSCEVSPDYVKFSQAALAGIRWNTGSENALEAHLPWQAWAKKIKSNSWKVQCDGLEIGSDVRASYPRPLENAPDEVALTAKYPPWNGGMSFLNRGKFTFDLPHGRLWFSKEALQKKIRVNRSGVELKFVQVDSDRALKVKGIKNSKLIRDGLTLNAQVTQMDGKDVSEMDQWEVERRLSGEFGDQVVLQWKVREGLKMTLLKLE